MSPRLRSYLISFLQHKNKVGLEIPYFVNKETEAREV